MEKQDYGSMTPLPAAHLVGAGPGDRALDGRHPLHLRLPQAALFHDAARGRGVEDQARARSASTTRATSAGRGRASPPSWSSPATAPRTTTSTGSGNESPVIERRVQRGRPEGVPGLPLAHRLREPAAHVLVRAGPRGEVLAEPGGGRHAAGNRAALRLRRLRAGGRAARPRTWTRGGASWPAWAWPGWRPAPSAATRASRRRSRPASIPRPGTWRRRSASSPASSPATGRPHRG